MSQFDPTPETVKYHYQWEALMYERPVKDLSAWQPSYGPFVISRDSTGRAAKVRFQVLVDNPKTRVFLTGAFNDWGKDRRLLERNELFHDAEHSMACIETSDLHHKDPYKFIVELNGVRTFLQDPAGVYFDREGNSVLWDFDGPDAYHMRHEFIDNFNRPIIILQTELPGLIAHWSGPSGLCGRDVPADNYYSFITHSGVLEEIKELGFNTLQFLPFAQSIDGDNWKFRYLVPFQYAVNRKWGTPDEFSELVDTCHKLGIALVGDFVISHFPYRDYRIFGMDCAPNGIHPWKNRHGAALYMKEPTGWGTMRPDYDNPWVRQFLIDGVMSFMRHYRIDGFRIDNVDGILRYGENGDGMERPYGRRFLQDLTRTLYAYHPGALVHFESHFFFGDNAKMLVVPYETDARALGATAYNDSRTTHYFHKEYMLKSSDQISPWRFRDIASEKEWGQSNSTISDFHNHDAAAGLMHERCTGSYAYDAMTCNNPECHFHAVGKIKVMEAIIAFAAEGRILDLAQTFLLQKGTFEHDSSIQWYLTYNELNRNVLMYKREINRILLDAAFWPRYSKNRRFLNVDDKNKILVIERSGNRDGQESKYVIVINLASWGHGSYKFGVKSGRLYKVIFNSDLLEYAGTGQESYPEAYVVQPSNDFEFLEKAIELPVPAYGVLVLKLFR